MTCAEWRTGWAYRRNFGCRELLVNTWGTVVPNVSGVQHTDDLTSQFADLLAWNPQLAERLGRAHVRDACGRCAGCRSSVWQSPMWPCRIATLNTAASALAAVRLDDAKRAAVKVAA